MRLFDSAIWHGVCDDVERLVHILFEEALELVASEEPLNTVIVINSLPDNSLLTEGGKGLVVVSVQVFELPEVLDGTVTSIWTR